MNKIFLLLALILLCSFVFANNPSIDDINSPTKTYIGETANFEVNFTPDDTNGNIRFYVDNVLISQKEYTTLDSAKSFSYIWSTNGDKNIEFVMGDFNTTGNDVNDDTKKTSVYIWHGLDLTIDSFSINPLAPKPNDTITLTVVVKNVGDENYYSSIPITVELDNNIISTFSIPQIITDYTTTHSFVFPSDTFEQHSLRVTVNKENTITETTYLNNYLTQIINGADQLDLIPFKITLDDQIRTGSLQNIGIGVRNTGDFSAENFNVKVYEGDKKIYEKTLSVNKKSESSFSFLYSFSMIGETTLKVIVDSNNEFVEKYENNNEFSRVLNVMDFNLNSVLEENDEYLRQQIIDQAKINSLEAENKNFKDSISNLERQNSSCTTNLNICNDTLGTKLNTHLDGLDANSSAEKTILATALVNCSAKTIKAEDDCEKEKKVLLDEYNFDNQLLIWALIILVLGVIIYFNKDELVKFKKEKGSIYG